MIRKTLKMFDEILKMVPKILKIFHKTLKKFRKILKMFRKILKMFREILKMFCKILKNFREILKMFRKPLKMFPPSYPLWPLKSFVFFPLKTSSYTSIMLDSEGHLRKQYVAVCSSITVSKNRIKNDFCLVVEKLDDLSGLDLRYRLDDTG